jgi:hypothetical protein
MRFLTALGRRRTWSELLYTLLGLPIGVAGFAFVVAEMSVSATLLVTLVGLPLLAVTGLASRWLGSGLRSLANTMIRAEVPPARPFRAKPGMLGWIGSCLTDGTAWRARLYLTLKLPIGVAGFVAAVAAYGYGLFGVTYAAWRPFLPCDGRKDGVCHRAAQLGSHYVDTPSQIVLVLVTGVALLVLAPWPVRGLLAIDKFMLRALLGPASATSRVAGRSDAHQAATPPRPVANTASQPTWSAS